jgi:hypothetical protein
MRLYKIAGISADDGCVIAWAGTQADAKAAAKTMKDDFTMESKPEIEEVDFPTDKPSLLTYLNTYFTRDNG